MRTTAVGRRFAVYDDVLEGSLLASVRDLIPKMRWEERASKRLSRIFGINPVGHYDTPSFRLSEEADANCPVQRMMTIILRIYRETAFSHPDGAGVEQFASADAGIYGSFALQASGTGLTWHDDGDHRSACILYVHPTWNANWGGGNSTS